MPGTMRGVYTNLTEIRRKVFAGVARIAYEQGEDSEGDLQRLPYEIVPGEIATYRESVFLERDADGKHAADIDEVAETFEAATPANQNQDTE